MREDETNIPPLVTPFTVQFGALAALVFLALMLLSRRVSFDARREGLSSRGCQSAGDIDVGEALPFASRTT